MCGIAGFVGFSDGDLLRSMCAVITHRGPDDDGYYEEPGVGLAIRRLAIIDLKTGHQPMANETRDVWVVMNGEIYNYQDLTTQLKQRGHVFRSTSDTETIVHLYEEYGLDFVDHLRGMFAVALWDTKKRRLVIARDRIGEKPLYFADGDGQLVFGSEIKSILQRRKSRSVCAQAVCDFLAGGYVPAPRTFFEGIKKLPPGHMAVHESGRTEIRRYWQRGLNGRSTESFSSASASLEERLRETVKLCLKSDVEVGAFLSGGIDSSLLVALMAEQSARVQTFTVGYRGAASGFNEFQFAKRMADEIGTKHHELILEPGSTIELLPRVLWHFDEPHGEPSSILVYLLCEFSRRYVKVAVGGTGGDEIFYGYPRHKGIRFLHYYRYLPRSLRRQVIERIVQRWPESTKGSRFAKRAKRFLTGADQAPEEAYLSWTSLLDRELRGQLVSEAVQAQAADPSGEAFLRDYLMAEDRGDLYGRAADLDVDGYLPEYQLAYMDRMSMAHGLEVRSPLCDFRLVDFVMSLPTQYRLKGLHSKHLLKVVARRWIPRAIVERPKVGFDSPIGQWIKDQLREFTTKFLSRDNIERSGLLNYDGVQQILGHHLAGRRDYSLQLWSLLALEGWYRMYIEDAITDGRDYAIGDFRGVTRKSLASIGRWDSDHRKPVPVDTPPTNGRSIVGGLGWTRNQLWEATPRALRGAVGRTLTLLPPSLLWGKQFRRCLNFVEKAQWWSADEANALQLREVRRICQLAYTRTPYYRRAFREIGFDPHDLKSTDDLTGLPLIDRDVVRENLHQMCTVPPASRGVDYVSTGGSGGAPLHFYIGADRSPIEYAYLVSSWRRVGYELGMPIAVFRGRVVAPDRSGLRHEYDPILRHHYYSNFHMTDENMARYLEHLRGIGPCVLHAYPSAVATLARFMQRERVKRPENVTAIIAESETVYAEQRRMVEEVFGARYFSCLGHSEKLVAAVECAHSTDYHVWPTYGFFELLDEDGERITTPGRRGEIVGTGFINRVVPFIRYRTGDFATYVADRCNACGREHTIIADIRGHRTQEMLVAADHSQIAWTALNMHDDTFANVRQFQFYQDTPGRAVLRLVPAAGFAEQDQRRIIRNLGRKLDGQLQIDIALVNSIRLSPIGKAIYVDQRIAERE
ncbi:MAG: asparagine synthase (glutamine-hydrolyzing) [Planctomycetes bacterium]|nr:asparagine synthase (glutamine-hydrolyzing) [Planctomycetota bacterium]